MSKYVAGREKDLLFVKVAAEHGIVQRAQLEQRLAVLKISDAQRELVAQRIARDHAG